MKTISTGLSELDALMNGGIDAGELGIVASQTGMGKSHFLVHLGSSALRQDKKVLHISLELSSLNVSQRYGACLFGYMDNYVDSNVLRIIDYPAKTLTIKQLYSDFGSLVDDGFVPDLLIVDYPQLMKSTDSSVDFELRNFGGYYNLPIWGASQLGRDTNTDSSFYSADVVLKLHRSKELDELKFATLRLEKSRKGLSGITIPLWNVDFSTSHFEVDSVVFKAMTNNKQ